MGGRIARKSAAVQRDAVPGQALHERHGRVVVQVGAVVRFLLQDCIDARRCLVPGPTGRHRGDADRYAVAVHRRSLRPEVHDHDHGTAGCNLRGPEILARSKPRRSLRHGAGGQRRRFRHGREHKKEGNRQHGMDHRPKPGRGLSVSSLSLPRNHPVPRGRSLSVRARRAVRVGGAAFREQH